MTIAHSERVGTPKSWPIAAAAAQIVNVVSVIRPFTSVARMVTVGQPGVVGVPDSTPPGESVSPGGRVPLTTVKVMGAVPPLGMSVCVKGTPTVPGGSVSGAIVMGGPLHPPTKLLPAIVTSPPAAAKARPVRRAPVPRWTPASATTVPGNVFPLRVAKLVTCQNTLQGSTPIRVTLEPTSAVIELIARKMKIPPPVPAPVRMRGAPFVKRAAPVV